MQTSDFNTLIRSRRLISNWLDKSVPEQLTTDTIEFTTWPHYNTNRKIMILGPESHVETAPYDGERVA